MKSSFTKRRVQTDIKQTTARSAVKPAQPAVPQPAAAKPDTTPAAAPATPVSTPAPATPAPKPLVFYQAGAHGETVIRADGTKERKSNNLHRNSRPNNRTDNRPKKWQKKTNPRMTRKADTMPKRSYDKTTADGKPKLRIIPVGGLEEIGKNMTILEYGNDIVIIDMGLSFPDTDMLGIDYVIPDVTYLEEFKQNIRGAIITHGHLDHIGAVPYIIEKIGFPRLYGSDVTLGLVKQRLEEFAINDGGRLQTVSPDGESIQLGVFKINFFRLNHSIPGAMGLDIETPVGRFVYATDWKFDYTPADGKPASFHQIAQLGVDGVKILFSDSTNAEKPGHTISEAVVEKALSQIIEETDGRLIIAMFSTLINRMQQVINAAHKHGRKILIVGMSMQKSLEMAIGIKAVTVPPNTMVSERQAKNIPDNKLVVLSTGAQGEDRAALARMARGDHKVIKIRKGDTVVISASPIPGNERSVSNVMDAIYRAGGQVIYNKQLDVHTSGHGSQEDLKLMIALTKPEYFVPIHGDRHKLIIHAKIAQSLGVDSNKTIVGSDGQVIEVLPDGKVQITKEYIPHGFIMVDGLGVGDVGNIVLRDRKAMSTNGMFVAVAIVDRKTGNLKTSPDIISRGFIYMRENEELVNEARQLVRTIVTQAYTGKKPDMSDVKEEVRRKLIKFLFNKTEREPLVIAVLKEV